MFELNYLIDTKTTANYCLFTYIVFYYVTKPLNVWTRDEVVVVLLIRDRKQIPMSGSVAKMFDIYWAMVWWGGRVGVLWYICCQPWRSKACRQDIYCPCTSVKPTRGDNSLSRPFPPLYYGQWLSVCFSFFIHKTDEVM